MLRVGLTGSIAVGKSHVVSIFKELGCLVFDADIIAHTVMEPGKPAYQDVVDEFGSDILAPGGRIDRKKLGALVFNEGARRIRLNEIVHPRVKAEQDRLLSQAEALSPNGIAIVDAALMIESGGYKRFHKLIVVFCDHESQVQRLMSRNSLTRREAERRIAAQMSSDEKRRYADYQLDTSGTLDQTRQRTVELYQALARLSNTSSST